MSALAPTRRALLGGLAAASLPVQAGAQDRPTFVVGAYGGLFEGILRNRVIPAFEAAHNVRVVLEVGQGTTFLPKLIAAGNRRAPYDVVYVNDDEAALGDTIGLWAPDMSARMPSMAAIYPALRWSKEVPLYITTVYDFPLLHRTSIAPPGSWGELWATDRPVGAPHISNSYGLTFLLIAALLNGGDAGNLAPAFPAIKRLKAAKVWRGVTQGYAMFQRGEVEAGLMYSHRGQQLIDDGLPLAMARPSEGVWGQRTGVQIPKAATRPELSAAWAEMALGVEYQAAFAEALYGPSNAKVALAPALAAKLVTGEERIARLRFPDWAAINPQRDALADRWNRDVGN